MDSTAVRTLNPRPCRGFLQSLSLVVSRRILMIKPTTLVAALRLQVASDCQPIRYRPSLTFKQLTFSVRVTFSSTAARTEEHHVCVRTAQARAYVNDFVAWIDIGLYTIVHLTLGMTQTLDFYHEPLVHSTVGFVLDVFRTTVDKTWTRDVEAACQNSGAVCRPELQHDRSLWGLQVRCGYDSKLFKRE
ncbi:Aste57867_14473 [Aphanomyces stellatus]|uniref:Aste57867_14473 protein n=1 Tax=Aphanomyces stellatus TaxID=120398 RepID=A0A485L1U8_9STRA|nr:hypothetical protein As57867_014419 [Aphanomyces stellatus]VFT91295.1 Aste57867_14473 [Aphanomyces stellatus]